MKLISILPLLFVVIAFCSCEPKTTDNYSVDSNPAADGFDLENSDPAAVELADSIMQAMGGRRNWDDTRFISWNFFGNRDLIWDKMKNRVRIESHRDSITYLLDLGTMEGRVSVKGQELAPGDSLTKMLNRGKSIWINDSYWLVMPYKLKDTGLTIKYVGEDTLMTGGKCNVLELRFNEVGDTPQNKYLVYVDMADNLVKQWAYYRQATQDSANFVRPWDNYQQYGNILLSADRSDNSGPRNVKVSDTLPEGTFAEF